MGTESLEFKRMKLEQLKVGTAKAELEFRIQEKLEEINRLKEHILAQEKREMELDKLLNEMKG